MKYNYYPMDKTTVTLLFDYNYWANQRIFKAAQRVSQEQYAAPYPLSHGSLRGMLVHTLSAERIWRQRVQEAISPTAMLKESDFPDLQTLLAV